jgi:sialidase-1
MSPVIQPPAKNVCRRKLPACGSTSRQLVVTDNPKRRRSISKHHAFWGVVVAFFFALPALADKTHVDVFVSGTEGYHTFRIPAIETSPDGTLLAFAESRKHNAQDPGYGKQDIDLVLRQSSDGDVSWSNMCLGQTCVLVKHVSWSNMRIIEDPGEGWSAANPATAVDRDTGRVWVLYLRSKPGRSSITSRPGTDDIQTFARYSNDNGSSWSDPIDLTDVARDMNDPGWRCSVTGPGGMVQTRGGRLVAPAWKAPYTVLAIFSDDHGRTWQRRSVNAG